MPRHRSMTHLRRRHVHAWTLILFPNSDHKSQDVSLGPGNLPAVPDDADMVNPSLRVRLAEIRPQPLLGGIPTQTMATSIEYRGPLTSRVMLKLTFCGVERTLHGIAG